MTTTALREAYQASVQQRNALRGCTFDKSCAGSMTSADYEILASLLHNGLTNSRLVEHAISALTDALRRDNPNFADASFWAAAMHGTEEESQS